MWLNKHTVNRTSICNHAAPGLFDKNKDALSCLKIFLQADEGTVQIAEKYAKGMTLSFILSPKACV